MTEDDMKPFEPRIRVEEFVGQSEADRYERLTRVGVVDSWFLQSLKYESKSGTVIGTAIFAEVVHIK